MTISEMLNKREALQANIKRLEDEVEELGNDLMNEFERARQDFSSPEVLENWSNYDAPITTRKEYSEKFSNLNIPF